MSTQVFVASTGFGLATLTAALDDGLYPDAGRRVLVTSNNAKVPETAPEISDLAGMGALLERFDAVHSYNEMVAPQHPSRWRPRAEDLPIWQRHLQASWGLDGDLLLVVESIQVPPALVLCSALPDARIEVYGDGLMGYGPTRIGLPSSVAARIERLLHLDLLPGVRPLLLSEYGVSATVISGEAIGKVIDGLEPISELPLSDTRSTAILLGQYLAEIDLLTPAEEHDLHLQMVQGAVAAGFRTLVFKPHPSASGLTTRPLLLRARRLGADLTVSSAPALVEPWFRSDQIGLVVGCFSTALMTASSLYGLPVARVGTEVLLARLRPYENSNRIPLTVVDAAVPNLADCAQDADDRLVPTNGAALEALLHTVGYCMQPKLYPGLRGRAVSFLATGWRSHRRYLSRGRLARLDLPGGSKAPRRPLQRALFASIGPTRYRRLGRIWRRLRGARNTDENQ